jgi:uncharacterized protein YigE (DUF2233 family)
MASACRARIGWALAALAALAPSAGAAADAFTVVPVDTRVDELRLFLADAAGRPYRSFASLEQDLERCGQRLSFAMNAGMYEADGSPVGLLVVDGVRQAPLNLRGGTGNFFLKPNGVFLVDAAGPRVVDAADYAAVARDVRLATQSGPLLLKGGRVNAAFRPGSASRLIRNGVCAKGRTAYFAISNVPVNFHEFAVFFRDVLGCRDALYLDGVVSSLHSAALGRSDDVAALGPLVAVVHPARPASASGAAVH